MPMPAYRTIRDTGRDYRVTITRSLSGKHERIVIERAQLTLVPGRQRRARCYVTIADALVSAGETSDYLDQMKIALRGGLDRALVREAIRD